MRDSILLICVTFVIEGKFFPSKVLADTSSDSYTTCVDVNGNKFPPGEVVPSAHPCRSCICGSKGNILCDSLIRITDCKPPLTSSLCKIINGSTCCERSFSCDRLKECSYAGSFYQPGEVAKHGNERCQTCICGFDGKVECQPHNSCGKPDWISDLGATDCTPVYAGKNCCPVDYSCKCTIFNETLGRGPRNVARCNTCSCSKSSGVTPCKPMTCKVPYKFSDKCKAIYRGNDCCPVDYDCGGSAKSSHHKLFESFNTARPAISRTEFYDMLPYGTEIWTTQRPSEVVGRSSSSESFQKLQTDRSVDQKKLRNIPLGVGSSAQNLTSNEAVHLPTGDEPDSGKVVIVVDGTLNGPIATNVPDIKTPIVSTQLTTHDALLKVFMKQAEKASQGTTKVTEQTDLTSTTDATNQFYDLLSYGTAASSTNLSNRHVKTKNRMDTKLAPSLVQSNNPGGMFQSTSLETSTTTTATTDHPFSSSSKLITDLLTGKTDVAVADEVARTSTSGLTATVTTLNPTTISDSTSRTPETTRITSTASFPTTDSNVITGMFRKATTTKKPTTSWNASRFSLDNQYSMSSADAGFLADDLSYKLFSVNFFRSPLKEMHPTTLSPTKHVLTPGPAVAWEALNFSDVSLADNLAQQGQKDPFHSYNLTGVSATMNATGELQSDLLAEANSSSTVPPDYQVVTFGAKPRNHRPKSAGQLLPPALSPGLGGPNTPILPFTTEIEFKGFGMEPEIEIKPLKGLAGAAAMAGMLSGLAGGGGGALNVGGQLAGMGSGNSNNAGGGSLVAAGGGGANAATKLAAAVSVHDAMEELAEGGTGDGALALAAALMQNPNRPMAARLVDSTKVGRITTPAPTVAVVFPNGSTQVNAALREYPGNPNAEGKNNAAALEGINLGSRRIGEFNSFFPPSQNHNFQFSGMSNPWSSPIFTGAAMGTAGHTTTDRTASTKDPFPFEMVADVIEEGRGPALTQLLGALQMMGGRQGGMGGMPAAFPMGPPPRGSMAGMNAMMNAMNPMMNRNSFFPSFPQQSTGTGMEGIFGAGGLFNLFAGSLSALESTAPAVEPTRIVPSSSKSGSGQQTLVEPKRRPGPTLSLTADNSNLRPMYKVSSGLTESPVAQPRGRGLE